MCEILKKSNPTKDGVDWSITCKFTGKPISISNEYGMFCEDLCELDECKKAKTKIENLFKCWGIGR